MSIEKQIEINPFSILLGQPENDAIPINHRLAKKIIELIGWNNFSENVNIQVYNEFTLENDHHQIDFYGNFESKLIAETEDVIFITAVHDLTYPNTSKSQISRYLYDTGKVFKDLKQKNQLPSNRKYYNYHNILFWLTTENNEINKEFVYHVKENYKRDLLGDDFNYYFFDNSNANFLISSIVTAKNYRPDLTVKFLYPITESNQNPGSIGLRGTKLPAQYINSSVLPIIKESSTQISILLFCSDAFSEEALKKMIWLTIRLTSNLGNEYLIFFSDYDESKHKNSTFDIIRSYNDDSLEGKIKVNKYQNINTEALASLDIPLTDFSKNLTFVEKKEDSTVLSKHLNEVFLSILPYGDILKPFLRTDGITSIDLKIFLGKKGIFVRNADKERLVQLMSTLLFSPRELEDFKELIDIKSRPTNTTNEIFKIKENSSLDNVFNRININYDNITEGISSKLLDTPSFKKSITNPSEYIFTVRTEHKKANEQISVNTEWGKIEIICKKEGDNLVVNQISSVSKDDKIIANKIMKVVEDEFKRINFIENESLKVMFKSFMNNTDRIHFLLSYMTISSSHILRDPDIRSIKYKFDDNEEIPDEYKDKIGKDLTTQFNGKNLHELKEITQDHMKKIILLEEINITYKFEYLGVKTGFYNVNFNFSDAFKNKPEVDGVFKTTPSLVQTPSIKKLNLENVKRDLSKEVERLKLEKFKKFGFM